MDGNSDSFAKSRIGHEINNNEDEKSYGKNEVC